MKSLAHAIGRSEPIATHVYMLHLHLAELEKQLRSLDKHILVPSDNGLSDPHCPSQAYLDWLRKRKTTATKV